MDASNTINVEFNYKEAMMLRQSLMNQVPAKEDEFIISLLYARITRKIEERFGRLRE